jgi:hypothetical protein
VAHRRRCDVHHDFAVARLGNRALGDVEPAWRF